MKGTMKRLFSILLAMCMMLSVLPMGAFAEDNNSPTDETTVAEETTAPETGSPTTETTDPETTASTEETVADQPQGSGSLISRSATANDWGGGQQPNEKYFDGSQKFGYDSFLSGGDLSGVKYVMVKNGTYLTRGSASSTTGAANTNGVRIGFNPGWYLYRWKVVCGDKYKCQTDNNGNAVGAEKVMSGAGEAYCDISISKEAMGHSSRKDPYWLLIELKEDNTKYPVTYNWGILNDTLTSAVPEGGQYKVSTVVTVQTPSDAALSEAADLDYEFAGWVKSYSNVTENVSSGSTFAMPRAAVTLTAQWRIATTSFTVTKQWQDNNNQDKLRPDFVTVQLEQNGEPYGTTVTLNEENGWTYTWSGLPKRVSLGGDPAVYTVDEPTVPTGYSKSIEGSVITNTHIPETVEISGRKTWVDNNDQDRIRPDKITINLLADDVPVDSKTVTAADGWAWTFKDLAKYKDGVAINYTITEDPVSGYDADVKDYNVTNTHTPETVKISGEKTWADNGNQDGKRPQSITINLLADRELVASKTVTAADNWAWDFGNLPKYKNGNLINYTITEEAVTDYISVVDGYNVTNTHIPETVDISGEKTWEDNNNQDNLRPKKITINLLADDVPVDSKTVTAADGWAWTFEDLAKYKDGKEIAYTITEDPVSGYDADVKGYNVTNTHTPATVTISGEKTWVGDANVAAGDPRPESITVHLNADGVRVASKTVTPDQYGKWTYTFENMPKFANGQKIVYTVTEETVEGYTFSNGTDYNIVNTYTPGKTSVTVTKAWEDGGNQDGIRPASIQVQLKIKVLLVEIPVGDPVELNAANQWTYTFTDLDDIYKGVKISYTVAEVNVPAGYNAVVTGSQTDGYTITNTHTPAVTSVSVKKVWSDENDLAGFRPDSVQVQLYKTVGQEIAPVGSPVTLSDENRWEYTWQNLPAKEDGVAINYTVGESEVGHYTPSITGNMKDGFTITNTHVPQKMAVTVFKTWDDNNNEDNIRPDSVKVTLYRNGTKVDDVTLSEENQWTHTFPNLPVYAEGNAARYTVTETSVDDYQAEYVYTQTNAGMSVEIINHYTPTKTSIDVTKKWTDSGNKAGARPSKVTIYLLANGEKTGDELILTKENNWTGSFEDLPVMKNGKAIKYTISEKAVANYTAKITGNAKDGFVVTNTHVSIPTTGDESNLTMYAVLFSLGAMAVVSALILSRKKYGRRG